MEAKKDFLGLIHEYNKNIDHIANTMVAILLEMGGPISSKDVVNMMSEVNNLRCLVKHIYPRLELSIAHLSEKDWLAIWKKFQSPLNV